MFKSRILTILTIAVIAFSGMSPCCYAEPDGITTAAQEVSQKANNTEKQHKNNELKHVLKKFIIAMALVGGSCTVLYFVLNAYKRIVSVQTIEHKEIDVSKNLTTPETTEDATKLFIEKF